MPFLKLGTDIAVKKSLKDGARIEFIVLKPAAVDAFMANAALIGFLQDPLGGDESGCRLTIMQEGDTLIFQRQTGESTIMPLAYKDLLASLNTYIMPYDDSSRDSCSAWADMAGVAGIKLADIPKKSLARGEAFLPTEDGDHEPPHLSA